LHAPAQVIFELKYSASLSHKSVMGHYTLYSWTRQKQLYSNVDLLQLQRTDTNNQFPNLCVI